MQDNNTNLNLIAPMFFQLIAVKLDVGKKKHLHHQIRFNFLCVFDIKNNIEIH